MKSCCNSLPHHCWWQQTRGANCQFPWGIQTSWLRTRHIAHCISLSARQPVLITSSTARCSEPAQEKLKAYFYFHLEGYLESQISRGATTYWGKHVKFLMNEQSLRHFHFCIAFTYPYLDFFSFNIEEILNNFKGNYICISQSLFCLTNKTSIN